MRFLLAYSADHFDPNRPMAEHAHWGTSANVISRTLHAALSKRGDVTFIDAAEPDRVAGERFDAFFGIQRNFGTILERCSAERSVLVAVNMHPAEHNELLLGFVVREGLPTAVLHALDFQDVKRRTRDLDAADAILLVGNSRTKASYTRHDIPAAKVRPINYGVDIRVGRPGSHPAEGSPQTQLLYSASEIGLRKGFDIVTALADEVDLGELGAHLHIAGAASYPHYRAELDEFTERQRSHVTNHGWLPASSAAYRDLLDSCDYLLFPSLEEGQAGTVLDGMARGVVPLISRNCGVDFAPLGFCELERGSTKNREMLTQACALPGSERNSLRDETIDYYRKFHAGFEDRLESALDELIAAPGAAASRPRTTIAPGSTSLLLPRTGPGEGVLRLRQRTRLRYLVARLRWFNAWRFHELGGRVRRRLPV
jgi:Glycosyl transferases group 1